MMNQPLIPRLIERWYPDIFPKVAGNTDVVRIIKDSIVHGWSNTLVTGPSRTGKTRTISLGIKAQMCLNRLPDLSPCGRCPVCLELGECRFPEDGLFASLAGSKHEYFPVDCNSITAEGLHQLLRKIDDRSIVYLDEVAALGERNLEPLLLKPLDEVPCIWIASAITVKRQKAGARPRRVPGLSTPMEGRFAVKVGTSLPTDEDLGAWIVARCREWEIEIVDPEMTIRLMITRSQSRVGHVLKFIARGAGSGRVLDPARVGGMDLRT